MTPIRTFLLSSLAAALLIGGCASTKHEISPAAAGKVSVCTKCYDQIQKVRSTGGPLGGLATNRTITTHRCEECKSDMTIYEKDSVLKIRCASCAPEGVDCDRCVPKAIAK